MKNYQFYLEFESPSHKRKGISKENVLAAFGKFEMNGSREFVKGCLSAVSCDPVPNTSEMCWSDATSDYLHYNCKRISETKAREIHPNLFRILANYEPAEFVRQLKERGGKMISFVDNILTYVEVNGDVKTWNFY